MEEKIKNISIELENGTVYLQGVDGSIFSFNVFKLQLPTTNDMIE